MSNNDNNNEIQTNKKTTLKSESMKNIWEYSEIERKDFNMGVQDCKAGIYDKWYRYNHNDGGAAYDAGWQYKNEEVKNDKVVFLAGE